MGCVSIYISYRSQLYYIIWFVFSLFRLKITSAWMSMHTKLTGKHSKPATVDPYRDGELSGGAGLKGMRLLNWSSVLLRVLFFFFYRNYRFIYAFLNYKYFNTIFSTNLLPVSHQSQSGGTEARTEWQADAIPPHRAGRLTGTQTGHQALIPTVWWALGWGEMGPVRAIEEGHPLSPRGKPGKVS